MTENLLELYFGLIIDRKAKKRIYSQMTSKCVGAMTEKRGNSRHAGFPRIVVFCWRA